MPPYIKRSSVAEMADDWERYQTIYAQTRGSVAAPTAGLHFTSHLLEKVATLVLSVWLRHVACGLRNLCSVKTDRVEAHSCTTSATKSRLYAEYVQRGATGKTAESSPSEPPPSVLWKGAGRIGQRNIARLRQDKDFIYPPYQFSPR